MRALTFATALFVTMFGTTAWAQSDAGHDGHHPDQKDQQKQSESKAPPPNPSGSQRPPAGGMMGSGMPMMMGSGMPMMMGMMETMRLSGDGMGGMETIDRVEGRIAFLRTELKITDAQQPGWNAFSDALRANAKTLGGLRGSMMAQKSTGAPGLVEKLALQEKWLEARLDGTRSMKSALSNLVATLSDEQKSMADELLSSHMGLMPMMSTMRGGGMMGMGMPTPKSPQ